MQDVVVKNIIGSFFNQDVVVKNITISFLLNHVEKCFANKLLKKLG